MADEKPAVETSDSGIDNSQLPHGYRENHTNPDNGRVETRVWYHPAGVADGRWLSAAEWDDVNRNPLSSEVLNPDGEKRYSLVKGVTAVQAEGTDGKSGDYTLTFEATDKQVTLDAATFEQSFREVGDLGLE